MLLHIQTYVILNGRKKQTKSLFIGLQWKDLAEGLTVAVRHWCLARFVLHLKSPGRGATGTLRTVWGGIAFPFSPN